MRVGHAIGRIAPWAGCGVVILAGVVAPLASRETRPGPGEIAWGPEDGSYRVVFPSRPREIVDRLDLEQAAGGPIRLALRGACASRGRSYYRVDHAEVAAVPSDEAGTSDLLDAVPRRMAAHLRPTPRRHAAPFRGVPARYAELEDPAGRFRVVVRCLLHGGRLLRQIVTVPSDAWPAERSRIERFLGSLVLE